MVTLVVALTAMKGQCDEPALSARFDDEGVTVFENDYPVLSFQATAKSLDGKWERADYIHPLYDLQGEVISEDFPADHPHHRGIFWAWHQVFAGSTRLGDAWICKDFHWDVQSVSATTPSSLLTVTALTHWKSPLFIDDNQEPIAVVEEQVQIKVHPRQNQYRVIDVDLAILALVDDVRIGGSDDDKGYGGFSPRIQMAGEERFLSDSGELTPTTLAIAAGTWVNVTRPDRGVAFLIHRDNPQVSEQGANWILRRSGSMQNAVYPGREAVPLSNTHPLVLRYRMVIHDESIQHDTLEELQSRFWDSSR